MYKSLKILSLYCVRNGECYIQLMATAPLRSLLVGYAALMSVVRT